MNNEHGAIIYSEGKIYRTVDTSIECSYAAFDKAIKEVGGELALMVWKPKYQIWFREKWISTQKVKN